jgi:hypothetical protein
MKMYILAMLFVFALAASALALGADHPKEQLAAQGKNCVHGYFVNSTDVYFFRGNAEEFNKVAADLVKKGVRLQIRVQAGPKKARSPWDKADRDLAVDWSVTTGPAQGGFRQPNEPETVVLDVWLGGGNIKKDDVVYPSEAEIETIGATPKK